MFCSSTLKKITSISNYRGMFGEVNQTTHPSLYTTNILFDQKEPKEA
jgi:hypothetical protein